MPEWLQDSASDFHFIECADLEDGVAKILQIVRERIPTRYGLDPIRDIQVLCPMNRGGLGARSLNIDLQQALNGSGELRVERFGSTYGIGDKVMTTTMKRRSTTATSASSGASIPRSRRWSSSSTAVR